jgi:hypothetical protein
VAVAQVLTQQVEVTVRIRYGVASTAKTWDLGTLGQRLEPSLPAVGAVVADVQDPADVPPAQARSEEGKSVLPDGD